MVAMKPIWGPCGAVVLTTHERSGYFTSVLGHDIDLRLSPRHGFELDDALHNVVVAGGKLVVIDEAFFVDADDMALGLERFFENEAHPERLKIIIVCTHRKEGDALLAFLVMYCGIFNIIYDKSGVDLSIELIKLIRRGNTRSDVLHLAQAGRWDEVKKARELSAATGTHLEQGKESGQGPGVIRKINRDLLIDVEGVKLMSVNIEFTAVAR